ncbi:MAG TPA: glycosyltransferase family 4 protein [Rhizomicrobium sp.]|nr:glycosyltransferase family 4 protein [Rhizomicrobium sp.]
MEITDGTASPAQRGLKILYNHRTRSRDGQSIHIDELIHALRALGHEVIVIEPQRVDAMAVSVESKILPKFAYELAELGYSLLEFYRLSRAALKHRPDAFYQRANLYMLSGTWLARAFGFPYLLEVNAPLAQERGKFGGLSWPRLAAWTERTMWRNATVVLPVTKVLGRFVTDSGVPEAQIVVTPNGVDTTRFAPADTQAAKQALGLSSPLVLGFVGYVREWHGLEHVVDLVATDPALADAHLLIVGDGPAREALEARARDAGIAHKMTITGVVPHEKLPAYVSAFDIALQPEVTSYASPLKLFEYMAMARAIVAPASENILEVLEDGTDSLLFPQGDMAAFAQTIARLAADAPLRAKLGTGAANKIARRNLTWSGNAARVAALIRSLSHSPAARVS